MLFNSIEFFVFFACVYTLYRVLPFRAQNRLLLIAGYIFYGSWDLRFLVLLAFSTTVDFSIGAMLGKGCIRGVERIKSSLFLVGAAVLFVGLRWKALDLTLFAFADGRRALSPRLTAEWSRFLPDATGTAAIVATTLFVAAANLVYFGLVRVSEARRRRFLIFFTVFVNLGFLGVFKYFDFFVASGEVLLGSLGLPVELFHLSVILPVGISFYTFQSLSYTIDVYRGSFEPTERLSEYSLFVAYFAPMVAGPIERARHLMPQLRQPRTITVDQSLHGVFLVLRGLFLKVSIADGIAPSVNAIYDAAGAVSTADAVLATVLFAVQIYCDFAGYSDIAIGVSKLLGIELVTNFRVPYLSQNPSEFWRRWHISLSTWLRDYLYIPLGGNRTTAIKIYRNLMLTMVLGGLWHGAAWNYVLWGFYHGLLLSVHRFYTEVLAPQRSTKMHPVSVGARLAAMGKIPVFFGFTCYGWLLFRARSFGQIVVFSRALLGLSSVGGSVLPKPSTAALLGIPVLVILQLVEYLSGMNDPQLAWPRPVRAALYATMILILAMGTSNAPVQFIYFQF